MKYKVDITWIVRFGCRLTKCKETATDFQADRLLFTLGLAEAAFHSEGLEEERNFGSKSMWTPDHDLVGYLIPKIGFFLYVEFV